VALYCVYAENLCALVTLGIVTTFAAIDYGYLELGGSLERKTFLVPRFIEKPNREDAERHLALGLSVCLWDSGMSMWNAKRFLELLVKYKWQSTSQAS